MTGCGPPPVGTDRIVEVAILEEDLEGRRLDAWESLVNPGCPVSQGAVAVHGLTDQVLAQARPMADLQADIVVRVRGHVVVGHGVEHDRAFLQAELPGGALDDVWWVDTGRMAQKCLHLKRHTLSAVAQALGVPCDGLHRAGVDARVTRDVFWALYGRMGRPRLHRLASQAGARPRRGEVVQVLQQAFAEHRPVRIAYDRGRGATERTILIVGVSGAAVQAHCFLRGDERTFRLDRIMDARLAD